MLTDTQIALDLNTVMPRVALRLWKFARDAAQAGDHVLASSFANAAQGAEEDAERFAAQCR